MTDTTWEAELAIGCAACGAPAGSPCLNDQGKQVPYMHIGRVADAATGPVAAVTDTAQPDPQVVAWMRDRMSEEPYGMTAKEVRAYREANGLSAEDMEAAYEVAARKPLTVADIPAGQGAASLHAIREKLARDQSVLMDRKIAAYEARDTLREASLDGQIAGITLAMRYLTEAVQS